MTMTRKKDTKTDNNSSSNEDEEEEEETPEQQSNPQFLAPAPVQVPTHHHTPAHWVQQCWDKMESVSGSGEDEFPVNSGKLLTLIRKMADKKPAYVCRKLSENDPKEKEFAVFGSAPYDTKSAAAVNVVANILKPFATMLKQDSPKIWVFGKVTGKRAQFTVGKNEVTFQQVITHDQASKGKAQPEYLLYTEGVAFELTDSDGAKQKFRRFAVTSDSSSGADVMVKFCVDNIAKNPQVLTKQKFSVHYDSNRKRKLALITKGNFKMIAAVDHIAPANAEALVSMLARWIGGKQLSVGDRFYSSETDLGKLFEKHKGKRNHKLQKLAIQKVPGDVGVIPSVSTDAGGSFILFEVADRDKSIGKAAAAGPTAAATASPSAAGPSAPVLARA